MTLLVFTVLLVLFTSIYKLFKWLAPSRNWSNWGETVHCEPSKIFEPSTVKEVKQIILNAKEKNQTIRVVGCTHTWSSIIQVPRNGILVSTKKLNQILFFDAQKQRVIIEPGVIISQLDAFLEEHGFCIPTNVVLSSLTWGGLIAMGCHGASLKYECLSDMVESIEILTSTGDLVEFSEATHGTSVMNHVRLNLGALGIMTRITLKIVPYFHLEMKDLRYPVQEFSEAMIKDQISKYSYLEYFWFSTSNDMFTKTWKETHQKRTDAFYKHWYWNIRDFICVGVTTIIGRVVSMLIPRVVARACALITPILFNTSSSEIVSVNKGVHFFDHIEFGNKILSFDMCFRVSNQNFAHIVKLWKELIDKANAKFKETGKCPIFSAEMRINNPSKCYLSPAYSTNSSDFFAYIEFLAFESEEYRQFCNDVFKDWKQYDAKPHWPKHWQVIDEMVPLLKKQYGTRMEQFARLCKQYDPTGMFQNDVLKELFESNDTIVQ